MIQQSALVLHLLNGLVFSKSTRIGYDPLIMGVDEGSVVFCNKNKYSIVNTLFVDNMIHGRVTICWHTKRDGQNYVIKDSWPNIKRMNHEDKFLVKIAQLGTTGVPVLVEVKDLWVDGSSDSTDTQHVFMGEGPLVPHYVRESQVLILVYINGWSYNCRLSH